MSIARTRLLTRTNSIGSRNVIKHSRVFFGSGSAATVPRAKFVFGSNLTTWPLPHNFGYEPTIQCFDEGNKEIEGEITNGPLTSSVSFVIPSRGYAICD